MESKEKIITIYKVDYKIIDGDYITKDIRPVKIISDTDLFNINDYKTIKEIANLLKVNYSYLTLKVIDNQSNDLDLDFIFNNISKYLIDNQYIIIKDYI